MPPPKSGKDLTRDDIQILEHWVEDGANWSSHWSLTPLTKPSVPDTPSETSINGHNPIDNFIFAKQAEKGLAPSEEADALTLIRRLTFDLTGLPPTIDEIVAFQQAYHDHPDEAYEDLVERLLASPHYGERWGRHWLDVVKYADTCGYDKDKLRPNAWPYRDYVIRSFNQDKPYAQFVREQLAGDTLYPGEPDGILGLGFLAAGPWDFIGHVEVPESKIDGRIARHIDRDEMVSNTFNTFASTTVQCARCHDHKFDPVPQESYYALQALFAAVDRAERPYERSPAIEAQKASLLKAIQEGKTQLEELEEELETRLGPEMSDKASMVERLKTKIKLKEQPVEYGYHSSIAKSADAPKWVVIDLGESIPLRRIRLVAAYDDYANIGAGFGFPIRFKVETANNPDFEEPFPVADFTQVDFPNPKLATVEFSTLNQARYVRVTATKLAERQNDFIFALAEIEAIDEEGINRATHAQVSSIDSIEATPRWSRSNLIDGKKPTPNHPKSAQQWFTITREIADALAQAKTTKWRQQREAAVETIKKAERKMDRLPPGNMVYAAATHFKPQGSFRPTQGKPRSIQFLHRGDIQSPRHEVTPAIPTSLGYTAESAASMDNQTPESARRSQLALWLTAHENPLVWRSIVNRLWQWHFGEGLVSTPNDFGRMGQAPSHPALLDWLATTFRDSGGRFKQLHRLIVTSHTYRQSSASNSRWARLDSSNRYLWRMNRRRLEAEEMRDAILQVSGTLNPHMGGPGFYLFKLEKTDHSPHYEYHKYDPTDPAGHRRSVYRFIVRSQPDPFMTTLDCADSSQSTPKRDETLTALQALSLLNNKFSTYTSERFASRLEQETSDLKQQVKQGFQHVTGRAPSQSETELFHDYAEHHGLSNLCRVYFNLSEFSYLD